MNDLNTKIEDLTISVPLRFGGYAKRSAGQRSVLEISVLNMEAATIFQHIATLGRIASYDPDEVADLSGIITTLGRLGAAITEQIEMAENNCLFALKDAETLAQHQGERNARL